MNANRCRYLDIGPIRISVLGSHREVDLQSAKPRVRAKSEEIIGRANTLVQLLIDPPSLRLFIGLLFAGYQPGPSQQEVSYRLPLGYDICHLYKELCCLE